jgi:hypothetical protein
MSNNRFGIGTAAPVANLQVTGDAVFTTNVAIGLSTAATNRFHVQAGSTAFVINQNGNVGIGISNPTSSLHIGGTVRATAISTGTMFIGLLSTAGILSGIGIGGDRYSTDILTVGKVSTSASFVRVTSSGILGVTDISESGTLLVSRTTGGSLIQDNASTLTLETATSSAIIFDTATAERMRIAANGNVGIGTTAPTAKLDVAGDIDASSLITNNGPLSGVAGHHFLKTSDGSNRFVAGLSGLETGSNAGSNYTISRYNDSNVFMDTPFTISRSSGNVGIGIANPTQHFYVDDNTSAGYATYIRQQSTSGEGLAVECASSSANDYALQVGRSGQMNSLVVKGDGNVGIGKTNPLATLDVAGNAIVSGNIVSANLNLSYGYITTTFGGFPLVLDPNGDGHTIINPSSGNVGIGIGTTTVPDYKLDVRGDLRSSGTSRFGFLSETSDGIAIGNSNGYGSSPFIQGITNAGNPNNITINPAGGNVGIGIANPTQHFYVDDNTSAGYATYIRQQSTSGNGLGVQCESISASNYALQVGRSGQMNSLVVQGNGNVGIGSSQPFGKFNVVGESRLGWSYGETAGVGTAGVSIEGDETRAYIRGVSKGGDPTNLIMNPVSGNVGIGTSSPTAKLDVAGDIDASSLITNNGTISGAVAAHHFLRTSAGAPRFVVGLNDNGADYTISRYNDSNIFVDTPFTINRTSGNVGIGITAPLYEFHVNDNSTNYAMHIDQNNTSGNGLEIACSTASSSNFPLRIAFNTNSVAMVVKGDGNVGIGTSEPLGALHLTGPTDNTRLYLGGNPASSPWVIGNGPNGSNELTIFRHGISGQPAIHLEQSGSQYNVGIGTSNPTSTLHIVSSTSTNIIAGAMYNNSNWGVEFNGSRARGTLSSPTAVSSGDTLMGLFARGHDGTSFGNNVAAITMIADGDFSLTSEPTRIEFGTTGNASLVRETRMVIDNAGNVGIGTAAPTAKIHTRMANIDARHSWFQCENNNQGVLITHPNPTLNRSALTVQSGSPLTDIFIVRCDGNIFFRGNLYRDNKLFSGNIVEGLFTGGYPISSQFTTMINTISSNSTTSYFFRAGTTGIRITLSTIGAQPLWYSSAPANWLVTPTIFLEQNGETMSGNITANLVRISTEQLEIALGIYQYNVHFDFSIYDTVGNSYAESLSKMYIRIVNYNV